MDQGIDLLGALAINYVGSGKAAQSPTLRWNVIGSTDSPWTDGRFIAGLAGAAVDVLGVGGPTLRRVGNIAAHGALGSFVATEQVRAAAVARAQGQGPGMFQQQAPVAQIPQQQQQQRQGLPGLAAMFSQFAPNAFR